MHLSSPKGKCMPEYDTVLYILHISCPAHIEMLAVPFLSGINCGPLDEPKNGFVLLSGTAEGATATYSCRPGFVLEPEGENVRVCTHSGNWTGSVSKCRSTYVVTRFSLS